MKNALFLIFLSLILFGCKTNSSVKNADDVKTERTGKFEISLKGNPTTGYTWICTMKPEKSLSMYEKYLQDEHEEGMTGFGGTYVYTFTVPDFKKDSEENILLFFEYKRVWEKDPAIKSVEIELEEKNGKLVEKSRRYVGFDE